MVVWYTGMVLDDGEEANRGAAVVVAAPATYSQVQVFRNHIKWKVWNGLEWIYLQIKMIDRHLLIFHDCGVVLFLVLRRRVHCKAPFAQITNTWAFKKILEHFVDRNLNPVPDGHEGEANEETKGASYVRDQRDERVDENLFKGNRIILEMIKLYCISLRAEGWRGCTTHLWQCVAILSSLIHP